MGRIYIYIYIYIYNEFKFKTKSTVNCSMCGKCSGNGLQLLQSCECHG